MNKLLVLHFIISQILTYLGLHLHILRELIEAQKDGQDRLGKVRLLKPVCTKDMTSPTRKIPLVILGN